MALVHISTPAQASWLYHAGYNLYTVGRGQYYDPTQRPGPGRAQYLSHIGTPDQAKFLAGQGYQITQYAGGSYYTPRPPPRPRPTGYAFPAVTEPPFTSTEQSAWAQITQTLRQYGFAGGDLTALVNFAKQELINGKGSDQISLDLAQTPQFAKRFPAIIQRQKAGLPPVSPAEYVSLETSYEQLERAAGIPPDFASYDALIANDVAPTEYADRINQGYLAVAQAPQEVRDAMQVYYGVTPGQLAAYFLDPKKMEPQLLQQAAAAQVGGASAQSGFGLVSAGEAQRLAQMGINFSQAQQGFAKLAAESELYRGLPGQAEVPLTSEQLQMAQFGSDAETQKILARQAQYETGTTNVGTSVATTQAGATGLGPVQR
jgi:hypothetical protein